MGRSGKPAKNRLPKVVHQQESKPRTTCTGKACGYCSSTTQIPKRFNEYLIH